MPDWDPFTTKSIAGLLGAAVSLRFVGGTFIERATMAAGGAALSFYGSDWTTALLGMKGAEGLVGFLIGLFGMAIIAKIYEVIHALDAPKMAADAWARWIGR